jgi:hypothetical protein
MFPGLKSLPQHLGQGLFSKSPCFAFLVLASGDKPAPNEDGTYMETVQGQ